MVQVILIGVSAGAATALLFASVASGSALSVPLFYLAPLPILIAAMGWSHWAALTAAVVASAGLAAVFGGMFFIAFMLGVGLPAWWLGYLALLARPGAAPGALEWYPVGHLVFWAAIIGAAVVIAGMLTLGGDLDTFRASMRTGLERMLKIEGRTPSDSGAPSAGSSRLIDVLVAVLPPAAAVLATITNVVNLWLAERVVVVSGRLRRPPSDLAGMRFPAYAPMLTAAAVAATFLSGMSGRPVTLGGMYVATVIFGWPVLVMSLLGLADSAFDFRGRIARRRGPPNPQT